MDLIEQIDKYESELLNNIAISDEYKTRLDKLITETNALYSNSIDYLSQFELKDEKIEQASAQLNIWSEKINNERSLFVNKLFKNRLLKFVKNELECNSGIIGKFENNDSELFYQKQINQLRIHSLEDELNDDENEIEVNSMRIQFLINGNICIAYRYVDNDRDLHISMFDSKLNKLCTEFFETFGEFKLTKLKSSPILCLINEHCIEDSQGYDHDHSTIYKLDDDLTKLNELTVDYKIKAVDGFEAHLYCLSASYNVNRLVYVYDRSLNQVMGIGQQENLTIPFYISDSFRKMRVCDLYFVFLDGKQVVFMNKQNGMVDKKFNFDSFDFKLYGDGLHAFKYDKVNCNLVKYDFDGYSQMLSLEDSHIGFKMRQNMQLIDCFNGRLVFFDKDDLALIF
jgi:hypothetical protein